jgi:hypothetical protein
LDSSVAGKRTSRAPSNALQRDEERCEESE